MFINKSFLLSNKYSEELYFEFAEKLPIIDYHNHLSPKDIAQDTTYNDITDIWISQDHYKWRVMRTLGVDEFYITGSAKNKDKFKKWAEVFPDTIRNPLFHWSQLELARYFNIFDLLNSDNASKIYSETRDLLKKSTFSTQALLSKMNIESLNTTEDPTDDLKYHQILKKSNFETKVSTAFRPDKALFINDSGYNNYIDLLSQVSEIKINTYNDLCDALIKRIDYFHENSCRISDHGLKFIPYIPVASSSIESLFKKRRTNNPISEIESLQFQTTLLTFLSKEYNRRDWVQQFHLGAMRNNNSRMYKILGPDTGWDSIGDYTIAEGLSKFLDNLDKSNELSKTIIYNINPSDNEVLATMIGNFNDGSIKGKIQWGSGWWFLDQLDGMESQINTLSNMGLISTFIGMLTDSRSILSFPRHEYFRRLICDIFGKEMKKGLLPRDTKFIGSIISNICYYNAKKYFNQ